MGSRQALGRIAVTVAVSTTALSSVVSASAAATPRPPIAAAKSAAAAEEVVFAGYRRVDIAADTSGGLVVVAVRVDDQALMSRYRAPDGTWGEWDRLSSTAEHRIVEVEVAAGPPGRAVVVWRSGYRAFTRVRTPTAEWRPADGAAPGRR